MGASNPENELMSVAVSDVLTKFKGSDSDVDFSSGWHTIVSS